MDYKDFQQAKNFIFSDIQREIDLAKSGKNAGNFLCALGLLCYTEFAGDLKEKSSGTKTQRFNSFFRTLGPHYEKMIDDKIDVYGELRCGLAHKYFAEKSCVIYMPAVEQVTGLFLDEQQIYHFYVGKYFEDFKVALEKLEKDIYDIA
jgi:hypothetical protein